MPYPVSALGIPVGILVVRKFLAAFDIWEGSGGARVRPRSCLVPGEPEIYRRNAFPVWFRNKPDTTMESMIQND